MNQLIRRHPAAFALALALVLVACTGSSETGGLDFGLRLVVAGTVPTAIQTPEECQDTPAGQDTGTGPGLLLLSTRELDRAALEGTSARCARLAVVPTPSLPYDLVNLPQGNQLFVSLPVAGQVSVYRPIPNSLELVGTGLTVPVAAGRTFCPTRLSLSPDATVLAVLDDPADPVSGCSSNTGLPPRVVLFRLANLTAAPTVFEAPVSFQVDRFAGPVGITVTNESLFVLAPLSGSYRLSRFTLASATPTVPADARPVPVLAGGASALDLAPLGASLSLGFLQGFGGGATVSLNPADPSTSTPLRIGTGATATDVGPARRVITDTRSSLVAALGPAFLSLVRGADSSRQTFSAVDAVFTPDDFLYALTTTGFTRFDVSVFPTGLDPRAFFGLGFSDARAVAFVIETASTSAAGTSAR